MSGALLLSLVGGVAFTAWVLTGDPSLRSSKPAITLVLLLATGLSVTAVPVLARLLADVGLLDSEVGKLAMVTAVATDVGAWVLVALAVGLTAGSWSSLLVLVAATVITVVSALLTLRLLRTEPAGRFPARFPRSTTVLIAAMALVAAVLTKRAGLTEVCGALAVGFALSAKPQWEKVVGTVSRLGRQLVPVSFVATGITVLTSGVWSSPWGDRADRVRHGREGRGLLPRGTGGRQGTRTEPAPRRATQYAWAHRAGRAASWVQRRILTTPLFAAFVVSLLTTAMTDPVYGLIDWLGACLICWSVQVLRAVRGVDLAGRAVSRGWRVAGGGESGCG